METRETVPVHVINEIHENNVCSASKSSQKGPTIIGTQIKEKNQLVSKFLADKSIQNLHILDK